jgi:hypothetical protein
MSKRKCFRIGIAGMVPLACASSGRALTLDQKIANAWTFADSQVLATANLSSLNAGGGDVLYPSSTTGYTSWKTINSTNQSSGWDAAFFPGELWLLYGETGNSTFQTDAEKWTYPLQYALNGSDPDKGIVLDEDAGFQTELSWGNGLLYSTDSAYNGSAAVNTLVNNASYLNSRFLPEANNTGMIRSLGVPGNYSTVVWPTYANFSNSQISSLHINDASVIDHTMGLQLLFEAYDMDPNSTTEGYYQDAITDAVTSANEFVRKDGSSYHAVWYYDPTASPSLAGTVWGKGTEQGYANESTWSRGQAWGTYAFTQAYFYTRNDPTQISNGNVSLFLTTAQNMANYFWNNLPANLPHTSADYVVGDYVPPSDFNADSGEQDTTTDQQGNTYYDAAGTGVFNQDVSGTSSSKGKYVDDRFVGLGTYTPRDTAAAAIEAAAMLNLAEDEPTHTLGLQYFDEASDILGSLLTQSSTSGNGETDYFAQNTSGNALGVGLLLKYSLQWTPSSDYASAVYGDYYLLQAMTDYRVDEAQFAAPVPLVNNGQFIMSGTGTVGQITGAGTLTLQNGSRLTIAPGSPVSYQNGLTLQGTGTLDLTNNSLVITYANNAGSFNPNIEKTVRAEIINGFDDFKWDGNGITSSTAENDAANPETSPYKGDAAVGYADNNDLGNSSLPNNSVLVRFTYYGDADLNGKVDLNDFDDWLYGYTGGTDAAGGVSWSIGDFAYTGHVDLNDFDLWLASYTSGDGSLNTLDHAIDVSTLSSSQKTELLDIVASVPEPTSLGLLSMLSTGLLVRRKKTFVTATNHYRIPAGRENASQSNSRNRLGDYCALRCGHRQCADDATHRERHRFKFPHYSQR